MRLFSTILLACSSVMATNTITAQAAPDIHFMGYMSYSDIWSDETGNHPASGFYSFDLSTPGFVQHTNDDWDILARNGGVYAKGKYYAFGTAESWIFPDPKFYVVDAKTWKVEHTTAYGRTETYAMADMTYDYVHDELLAVAYYKKNNSGNGHLYRIDTANGAITELATLNALYVAVAADADGQLWTLSESGTLYRMERDGKTTKVGETGWRPQSDESTNSFTFDYRTGSLYWAASVYPQGEVDNIYRGLMVVDTTTGEARFVQQFAGSEKITALSVRCPDDLNAPDDILDLKLRPESAGSHKAMVRFSVPALSYCQRQLASTELVVTLCMDGKNPVNVQTTAGDAFEYLWGEPLTGSHTISVYLTDSEGRQSQIFSDTYYFGYDTPNAVGTPELSFDADRQNVSIKWQAPSSGVHGGDLDKANLRYLVTRYSPGEREDVAVDLAEPFYSETVERPMAYTRYGITAYTSEGESTVNSTKSTLLGQPLTLPFLTGINSWADFHQFLVIDGNGDGTGEWGTPTWYYDEAYGAAFCYLSYEDQDDYLVTPALNFVPGRQYQIIFQTYGYYGLTNHLQVLTGYRAEAEELTRVLFDEEYAVAMPSSFPYEMDDVYTVSVVFTAEEGNRYIAFHNLNAVPSNSPYTDHMSIDNIYIRDLEGTGVTSFVQKTDANTVYDLQGRTSMNSQRGVYVSAGRKIIK